MEISGISLVVRDGGAAWRGSWRRRRAEQGLPAQAAGLPAVVCLRLWNEPQPGSCWLTWMVLAGGNARTGTACA